MTDTFEFTFDNPLTEEQWDMIMDVDFDRTDNITIHTKHGKEVEYAKVRHGKWEPFDLTWGRSIYACACCGNAMEVQTVMGQPMFAYCPNCGARMDEDE